MSKVISFPYPSQDEGIAQSHPEVREPQPSLLVEKMRDGALRVKIYQGTALVRPRVQFAPARISE